MNHSSRDRVTIDLRGLGERLRAHAAARHLTTAALTRHALSRLLDEDPSAEASSSVVAMASEGRAVKVTLRLSAAHALLLARRAHAADVSQGAYVAGLIDGAPPAPRAPDHAEAIAALVGSTDQLAAIGVDINLLMQLLRRGSTTEANRYRGRVLSLVDDVRSHLALAAPLIAELKAMRRRPR